MGFMELLWECQRVVIFFGKVLKGKPLSGNKHTR